MGKRKKRKKVSVRTLLKRVLAAGAVFAVTAVCLVGICLEKGVFTDKELDTPPVIPAFSPKSEFDGQFDFGVFFLDVGQGDSSLIISGNSSVLIDAGTAEYGRAVTKQLKALGVEELDYLIATHPHADHIGGIPDVLGDISVKKKIIAPKVPSEMTATSKTYENFLDAVRNSGKKLTAAASGTVYDLDGTKMEMIAPCGSGYDDLNDYSVVCRITKGNVSFLFTGDASAAAEKDIIASGQNIDSDILKVGHHGSETASSYDFLNAVSPAACVISCGKGNSYGHPDEVVLKSISRYTDKIYRTDTMGMITVYSDGTKVFIKQERTQE